MHDEIVLRLEDGVPESRSSDPIAREEWQPESEYNLLSTALIEDSSVEKESTEFTVHGVTPFGHDAPLSRQSVLMTRREECEEDHGYSNNSKLYHINDGDGDGDGDSQNGDEENGFLGYFEEEVECGGDGHTEDYENDVFFDTMTVSFNLRIFLTQLFVHVFFPAAYFMVNYRAQYFYNASPFATFINTISSLILWAAIVMYYISPQEDRELFYGAIRISIILFLQHKLIVALKYSALSDTEYEKFQRCKDIDLTDKWGFQMMLLLGWSQREPMLISFELGAAAARIGAKINEVFFTVANPAESINAHNEFLHWAALLTGEKMIRSVSEIPQEFVPQKDGTFLLSVYDVCYAMICRSDHAVQLKNRIQSFVAYLFVVCVTAVPFVEMVLAAKTLSRRSWSIYVFLVLSSIINIVYGMVAVNLLMVAVWDVLRLVKLMQHLHTMIRVADISLDTKFRFHHKRKKKEVDRVRRRVKENMRIIMSVTQKHRPGEMPLCSHAMEEGPSAIAAAAAGGGATDVDADSNRNAAADPLLVRPSEVPPKHSPILSSFNVIVERTSASSRTPPTTNGESSGWGEQTTAARNMPNPHDTSAHRSGSGGSSAVWTDAAVDLKPMRAAETDGGLMLRALAGKPLTQSTVRNRGGSGGDSARQFVMHNHLHSRKRTKVDSSGKDEHNKQYIPNGGKQAAPSFTLSPNPFPNEESNPNSREPGSTRSATISHSLPLPYHRYRRHSQYPNQNYPQNLHQQSSGRSQAKAASLRRFTDYGNPETVADEPDPSSLPKVSFKLAQNVVSWTYTRLIFQHFGDRFRARVDGYTGKESAISRQ